MTKTKRINFAQPPCGDSFAVELGATNTGRVILTNLDHSMKARSVVMFPVEDLDEVIRSMLVLQEQLGQHMSAEVIRLVRDTGEQGQTGRFRWREAFNGYYVDDTATGQTQGMGDGVDMFCADEDDEDDCGCLSPGTQRFYDALNAYFQNEQREIAEAYFGIRNYSEEVRVGEGGR